MTIIFQTRRQSLHPSGVLSSSPWSGETPTYVTSSWALSAAKSVVMQLPPSMFQKVALNVGVKVEVVFIGVTKASTIS